MFASHSCSVIMLYMSSLQILHFAWHSHPVFLFLLLELNKKTLTSECPVIILYKLLQMLHFPSHSHPVIMLYMSLQILHFACHSHPVFLLLLLQLNKITLTSTDFNFIAPLYPVFHLIHSFTIISSLISLFSVFLFL